MRIINSDIFYCPTWSINVRISHSDKPFDCGLNELDVVSMIPFILNLFSYAGAHYSDRYVPFSFPRLTI